MQSAADVAFARELLTRKKCFIIDCDGVLYWNNQILPGVEEFVRYLRDGKGDRRFLFLTNSSDKTAADLVAKFARLGIEGLDESHFYTSAMATAAFVSRQCPGARAYVIGKSALRSELVSAGIRCVSRESAEVSTPDFVVLGETDEYTYHDIQLAVTLVRRGARCVGTNEDLYDRVDNTLEPGVGALIQPIAAITGTEPFFCGKPSPLMISRARERLKGAREETVMIGDRMGTDIKAGVEADVDTVLVLSGVTAMRDLARFGFRPSIILNGVGDIAALTNYIS